MIRLDARNPDFAARFAEIVAARREARVDVAHDVRAIIDQVAAQGDEALRALTLRFDNHDLDTTGWCIEAETIDEGCVAVPHALHDALALAAERITAFHERQHPKDDRCTDALGVEMGVRWRPVDAVGIYVPGGRAAYPSTVLMNAIPARVAGVGRIAMVTPTPLGALNPVVLAAARLARVTEIWRLGGAQAIAALACGTARIAPVDVVVGPGNAWVAEAKRQLYGRVGIDMVAGPSEIVVVADGRNPPRWIAADLLSQAEHDPASQSILITDDADFADRVEAEVAAMLPSLATEAVARASWADHGAILLLPSVMDAAPLIDALAPEHVELAVDNPEILFDRLRHAGSVFMGRHTPEAVGDYLGGPNHVLPTGRRARFASGLSVAHFMKRTSFLNCPPEALGVLGPSVICLADAEGLPAHGRSIAERLSSSPPIAR